MNVPLLEHFPSRAAMITSPLQYLLKYFRLTAATSAYRIFKNNNNNSKVTLIKQLTIWFQMNSDSEFFDSYAYVLLACGVLMFWFYLIHAEIERKWFPPSMQAQRFWRGKREIHQQCEQRSNANIFPLIRVLCFNYYLMESDWKGVPIVRNTLPINIVTSAAKALLADEPLQWIGFEHRPIEMVYENTGCDGNITICTQSIQIGDFYRSNFRFQFHSTASACVLCCSPNDGFIQNWRKPICSWRWIAWKLCVPCASFYIDANAERKVERSDRKPSHRRRILSA